MPRTAVLAPTTSRLALSTCMLATALCFTGCKEDSEAGVLTIAYQLGKASNTCESESVDTVRATVGDHDEDAPCGSDVIFSDVPEGTYNLLVEAIDEGGFTVMDNVADVDTQQVEVLGGSSREVTAQLSAAPARLYLRWSMSMDGFQAGCDEADVTTQQFEVSVWDEESNDLLSDTLDCNAPADEDRGERYRRIKDPDRDVQGSAIVELDVQAQTSGGDDVGDPVAFMFDPPGRGRELSFTLTCEDNVCTGTGEPDS